MQSLKVWPLYKESLHKGNLAILQWSSESSASQKLFALNCSEARLKKFEAYKHWADQQRCLAAGWLLNQVLNIFIGSSVLTEHVLPSGKVLLPEYPNLHLSITHSGEWVGCAVANSMVGIDIEYASPELFQNTKSSFECRDWTNREAYLKYLGTRLSLDIEKLKISRLGRQSFLAETSYWPSDYHQKDSRMVTGWDLELENNHWLSCYGDFEPVMEDQSVCSVL